MGREAVQPRIGAGRQDASHRRAVGKRLRLAIAGKILDFSIYADLDIAAAMETIAEAFKKPICGAMVGSRVPRDRGHAGRVPLPSDELVAELKRLKV